MHSYSSTTTAKNQLLRALKIFDKWFVLAALAGSLGINLYFGLHQRMQRPRSQSTVAVGEKVPALTAADLSGRKIELTWSSDQRPTILYVFSPSCVWCTRNLKNIKALSLAREADYRFIGLSLSTLNLKEYVASNDLNFPVYSYVSWSKAEQFNAGGTPATLIISHDGTVKELWLGAYAGSTKNKVEERMRVHLPGVPM